MAQHEFYEEEGSKLLTPGAFEFVLDTELKRAQAIAELHHAGHGRGRPRMGRRAGDGRRRHRPRSAPKSSAAKCAIPDLIGHTEQARSRWRCSTRTSNTRPA